MNKHDYARIGDMLDGLTGCCSLSHLQSMTPLQRLQQVIHAARSGSNGIDPLELAELLAQEAATTLRRIKDQADKAA